VEVTVLRIGPSGHTGTHDYIWGSFLKGLKSKVLFSGLSIGFLNQKHNACGNISHL
jgi:hypothetical protein